ncbi:Clavaminate synthase-like protein [Ananas comosus]|uniref:Clavaminate synthase-like protein n=1 Tax=Ananas comosus TaxID=4615 RepID=A0A199VR83_ANACO|nr:Clavaminate synthase-like protein [Ananas comosus]
MEILNNNFMMGECKGQKTVDGEQIPLVLHPQQDDQRSLGTLVASLKENKAWFEEKLLRNSAVLLRGFDVRDAEGFNDVVEALGWDDIRYVGPAPRTHVYKRVWTANEGPLSEFIYYHHEMVLIKEFPTQVILFCEVPPPEGGETPFVPSFRVTERMLEEFPEIVEEMEEKGLRAKALGMEVEWLPNGGATTILGPRPLTRVFPKRKGRRMWFNTLVGMHGKAISSATMADGSEIPADVVKRCGEIIEEESIQFKWEKGDILFLDNLATLHGRRPSLPPRRVLVATCK